MKKPHLFANLFLGLAIAGLVSSAGSPTALAQNSTAGEAPALKGAKPKAAKSAVSKKAKPSGCWAALYKNSGYNGQAPQREEPTGKASYARDGRLTLTGPLTVRDLDALGGADGVEVRSLVAGPKASVCVFPKEGYAGEPVCITPGAQVPSYAGEIESVSLACVEEQASLKK